MTTEETKEQKEARIQRLFKQYKLTQGELDVLLAFENYTGFDLLIGEPGGVASKADFRDCFKANIEWFRQHAEDMAQGAEREFRDILGSFYGDTDIEDDAETFREAPELQTETEGQIVTAHAETTARKVPVVNKVKVGKLLKKDKGRDLGGIATEQIVANNLDDILRSVKITGIDGDLKLLKKDGIPALDVTIPSSDPYPSEGYFSFIIGAYAITEAKLIYHAQSVSGFSYRVTDYCIHVIDK